MNKVNKIAQRLGVALRVLFGDAEFIAVYNKHNGGCNLFNIASKCLTRHFASEDKDRQIARQNMLENIFSRDTSIIQIARKKRIEEVDFVTYDCLSEKILEELKQVEIE